MDLTLERDGTALGSLFQQIIADMKNTSPLWEDFLSKASKLHACLRAAIQAISSYLDAFQKIADAATNSKGASKEIGTALTRVCLRHKAVENRLKTFTSAIMDCLVLPLQDKLEDWKRQVATIDKEHAKEYKRSRAELKKRSSDTLRLQKKARKGQSDTIQSLVDSHMQDVTQRRVELEEVEKKSLRSAMVEERMRYCTFVHMLQPVVKEECEVMSELGHLQEAMQSIAIVTKEPNVLPQSSEELILDAKSTLNLYPESPGGTSSSLGACSNSLGSRKSSVCSISSINSSGSSGSPGHHHYPRSLSQLISPTIRLKPGESSDSGFCSSPALTSQVSTATNQSHAVSTWPPHTQENVPNTERPHTISSAYEKGHLRPALTVYTYQNPETIMETSSQKSPAPIGRPPLPVRCSSLERPLSATNRNNNSNILPRQCPSPIPVHIAKELPQHQQQPTYVNMSELASMAALKITNQQLQVLPNQILAGKPSGSSPQQLQHQQSTDSHSSVSSAESSMSGMPHVSRSKTPSLQSHPSTDSTTTAGSNVATPTLGHTHTPSSGSSTPHNIFPLINNINNTLLTQYSEDLLGNDDSKNPLSAAIVGQNEQSLKITETENILNCTSSITTTINTTPSSANSISINNDSSSSLASGTADKEEISRGSVLAKTSMFEKQAAAANNNTSLSSGRSNHSISSGESIYSNRKDEMSVHKAASDSLNDMNSDKIYEDSIQELNNLIGELDSFQREHEMKFKGNERTKPALFQNSQIIKNENEIDTKAAIENTDSDKISLKSASFSTQNTNLNDVNFGYCDSEIIQYVSETSSIGGFENPTFAHFNQTDDVDFEKHINEDNDSGSVVMIYDHSLPIADIDYLKQNSEVVILRCKDPQALETTSDSYNVSSEQPLPKQRLSSFRTEQYSSTLTDNNNKDITTTTTTIEPELLLPPALPARTSKDALTSATTKNVGNNTNTNTLNCYIKKNNNNNSIEQNLDKKLSSMQYIHDQHEQQPPKLILASANSAYGNKTLKEQITSQLHQPLLLLPMSEKCFSTSSALLSSPSSLSSMIIHQQSSALLSNHPLTLANNGTKPNISPRPASLSGCVTRIARRSSVNSAKPLPPVRRSSSVTPSHNVSSTPNSPNLIQQNAINNSAESLPPPPAYLLNRQANHSSSTSLKVSDTVKALSAIRHTPASPSAIRRAQNIITQQQQSTTIQNQNQCTNNTYLSSHNNKHEVPVSLHKPSQTHLKPQSNTITLPQPKNLIKNQHNQHKQQIPTPQLLSTTPLSVNVSNLGNHNIVCSNSPNDINNQNRPSFRTNNSNSPSIYAQPKQVTSMSSFRSSSPGHSVCNVQQLNTVNPQQQYGSPSTPTQPKNNPNLIAQLNARLNKQQPLPNTANQNIYQDDQNCRNVVLGSSPNSSRLQNQDYNEQNESFYNCGTERGSYYYQQQVAPPSVGRHQQQQQQQYDDYSTTNCDKSGNNRTKSKAEFLENLNAKLAKQGISGRAFAVRSLINSKALPDPRICHESLMDQIKRGATLKRNKKTNDRSAPKIL